MDVSAVLQAIGVIGVTSFICWRVEQVAGLHPVVKRGLEITLVISMGWYLRGLLRIP